LARNIFVGYQDQQPKGYRIYLTLKQEIIITAHASFEDNLIRDPFIAETQGGDISRYCPEEQVEIGEITDVLKKSECGVEMYENRL